MSDQKLSPSATLDLARIALEGIVSQLKSIDQNLEQLLTILPEGDFESETDRPKNQAAELYGTVACLREDEFRQILTLLTGAAHNLE